MVSNLHEVRRIVAISPAGFVPRVPPLYYLLRACASSVLQFTENDGGRSVLTVAGCW